MNLNFRFFVFQFFWLIMVGLFFLLCNKKLEYRWKISKFSVKSVQKSDLVDHNVLHYLLVTIIHQHSHCISRNILFRYAHNGQIYNCEKRYRSRHLLEKCFRAMFLRLPYGSKFYITIRRNRRKQQLLFSFIIHFYQWKLD